LEVRIWLLDFSVISIYLSFDVLIEGLVGYKVGAGYRRCYGKSYTV